MTLLKQLHQLVPLTEAATAGPWGHPFASAIVATGLGDNNAIKAGAVVIADTDMNTPKSFDNAAFIAAARNLLTPENVARLIAALAPALAVTGWIAVADRLPEGENERLNDYCSQEVLIKVRCAEYAQSLGIAYYDREAGKWMVELDDEEFEMTDVTHWMNLPTPPTMPNTPDHA